MCFGDSNTWGYEPGTGSRYPLEIRWTGVMAARLGSGYMVVEEGLCGRTTAFEDPISPGRRGDEMLGRLCETHAPLDLVLIMLGTNDFKHRLNANPWDIAKALEKLALIAASPLYGRKDSPPRLLLVSPPLLGTIRESAESFEGGAEKSAKLAGYLAKFAQGLGAGFFDAASVASSSGTDGIHLDPPDHRALGLALAGEIETMLGARR